MVRNDLTGQIFAKEYKNAAAIGTTEPTSLWNVPITDADISQYEYFNKLRVINGSLVSVKVRFNGNSETAKEYEVPAQTMAIWDIDDKIKFANLVIRNASGVTDCAIGDITVNVMRVN